MRRVSALRASAERAMRVASELGVERVIGTRADVAGERARAFARAYAKSASVVSTHVHQPIQTKRPGKLPSDVAHTAKWLDSDAKPSPMEYSAATKPIGVRGDKVSCDSPGACKDRFGDSGGLGAPNTYYKLNDTSEEFPAKCKYCGLRFYTLDAH